MEDKQSIQALLTGEADIYTNAFSLKIYRRNEVAFLIRKYIRSFFELKDFLEVQTPFLCKKHNGGKSYPVTSAYLNNTIGYNRTTMEERMQLLVGLGFEDIYQIGSVIRSDKEITFLEGYSINLSMEEGEKLIKALCVYIALEMKNYNELPIAKFAGFLEKCDWDRKSYTEIIFSFFGKEIETRMYNPKESISY